MVQNSFAKFVPVETVQTVVSFTASLLSNDSIMSMVRGREGYEADGWLGLMLGTSLWYGLFGETLENEPFERKMDDLVRELGPRGLKHPVVAAKEKIKNLVESSSSS